MTMIKKLLKIIPTLSLTGTIVLSILYKTTSLEILLTFAITLGTITYHFAMRLFVAFLYRSAMHNRADYSRRWYQVSRAEMRFYEKLGVKRWKNKMPTYDPGTFDPRQHSWDEIAQATCQAELGHETIAVLSFLPILAGNWFGAYPVFVITSILSALFDLMFVAMQRYNRQRIVRLINGNHIEDQVMKDVFSYTKIPFVILIDEWDCLFREYNKIRSSEGMLRLRERCWSLSGIRMKKRWQKELIKRRKNIPV